MLHKCLITAIFVASFAVQNDVSRVIADDSPASNSETKEPTPGTPEYVEQALRKRVSLSVENATLKDVLRNLSKQVDVSILIDTSELDAVGLFADETKVTISLEGLSLRSVLHVILYDHELTYVNYAGVVLVTTLGSAEQILVTRIYEVVDLVSRHEDTPPSDYDYDSLIDVTRGTIAPKIWDEAGGPCSIDGYRGTIVVSATMEIH